VILEKQIGPNAIPGIHPFISIFNTCEIKIQEEIFAAVKIEAMNAASSRDIEEAKAEISALER